MMKEKQQEKLKERAAVALQFREIAQRGKRHKQLKNLAVQLEAKDRKLKNVLTAAKNKKFKKGVQVRSR